MLENIQVPFDEIYFKISVAKGSQTNLPQRNNLRISTSNSNPCEQNEPITSSEKIKTQKTNHIINLLLRPVFVSESKMKWVGLIASFVNI